MIVLPGPWKTSFFSCLVETGWYGASQNHTIPNPPKENCRFRCPIHFHANVPF